MEINRNYKKFSETIINPDFQQKMKPLFYDYFGKTVNTQVGLKYYFLESQKVFDKLKAENKDVLEVACGFGLRLICFKLLGCNNALGIDISPEMIEGFETLLQEFPGIDIETRNDDFLLEDYTPNSADIVMVVEAISHIRDTEGLIEKIYDILRPNGILYIRDFNNDLFLTSRIRARKDWKKAEYGPIDARMSKFGREVDKLSFFDARREIINNAYPSLDEDKINTLAKRTQGMYGEEITKSVEEFINKGKIECDASFPYRNPYTGEFPELGFNPFKLEKNIAKKGFICKFSPPTWSQISPPPHSSRFKRNALKLVSPIIRNSPNIFQPFISPSFEIIATKRKK